MTTMQITLSDPTPTDGTRQVSVTYKGETRSTTIFISNGNWYMPDTDERAAITGSPGYHLGSVSGNSRHYFMQTLDIVGRRIFPEIDGFEPTEEEMALATAKDLKRVRVGRTRTEFGNSYTISFHPQCRELWEKLYELAVAESHGKTPALPTDIFGQKYTWGILPKVAERDVFVVFEHKATVRNALSWMDEHGFIVIGTRPEEAEIPKPVEPVAPSAQAKTASSGLLPKLPLPPHLRKD